MSLSLPHGNPTPMPRFFLPGDLIKVEGKGRARVLAVDTQKGQALCLIYDSKEVSLEETSSLTQSKEKKDGPEPIPKVGRRKTLLKL